MKGTGQTFALMYLTFASTEMNPEQVSEFLTRVVQPRFATLEGVGDAEILGGRDFSMRVWLDPLRLAARGVTARRRRRGDPRQQLPRGARQDARTNTSPTRSRCRRRCRRRRPSATLPIRVRRRSGRAPARRGGCGARPRRAPTPSSASTASEGTFIGITPTPSANPLTVAAEVTKAIDEIRPTLPKGMTVEIVYDASNFISASIEEVFKTIGEAALIVIVVILLFLGSFRSVLIPIVTIPLSLVGVCFFLYRARLLDQPADPAGDGARHRPRGRRRHRRAGEHPPAHRGGAEARRCGHRGHEGDLPSRSSR